MSARACGACLGRAWLLQRLAARIEVAASHAPGAQVTEILALDDRALCEALKVPSPSALLAEARRRAGDVGAAAIRSDLVTTCRHQAGYPHALLDLGPGAPAALFASGDLELLGSVGPKDAVTVVGARRATAYGRDTAKQLGLLLASTGILVVSGLAYGIDAAAHRGTLEGDGAAIAVLGSGADVTYPRAHSGLHRQIASCGLVLSEMPPGFGPYRWCFPARNRIMAALSGITVVVEAAERSGALITARLARDLHREVGAVPGPVNRRSSRGTNALIRDGVALIRDAQDVLDEMLGPGVRYARPIPGPALEGELRHVLARVEAQGDSPDGIAVALGLPAHSVAVALARLELLGYVAVAPGGRYVRTSLPSPAGPSPAPS